jgi:C4-dicarboxylate transporter DctM subunit
MGFSPWGSTDFLRFRSEKGGWPFMLKIIRTIDKGIDWALSIAGQLTSVFLIFIALFVFANVVSRLAGQPLPWLFDVTCFSLVAFTFLGAGYGLREGVQVRVEAFTRHLSEATKTFLDIFVYAISVGFFVILGWTGWEWVYDSFVFGLTTTTAVLKFPKWIIISVIPLGSLFLSFQCLRILISSIHHLLRGAPNVPSQRLLDKPLTVFCLLIIALILGAVLLVYVHPLAGIFFFLLTFLFAGMPVAFALGTMGCLGIYFLFGVQQFAQIPITAFQAVNSWPLTAAPLFILGGMLMSESEAAERIFEFVELWFRRIPSPLLVATIISGGVFCAITGSSVAATATMAAICLPILFERGYDKPLSCGAVAGSTVGTLIPPSAGFILYGVVVDESIGQLFMAGIMPAAILFLFYILYVCFRSIITREEPKQLPQATTSKGKFVAFKSAVWGLIAPIIVLGGIYFGIFTPTEAGSVLVVYALIIGIFIYRTLRWRELKRAALGTVSISLMVMSIVSFASIYSSLVAQHQVIKDITAAIEAVNLSAAGFLLIVFLILLFLGMFLEAVAIMLLTLPLTYPIAMTLGINSLWFGVFYIINTEIGLLTPPVGLNLFVIKGVVSEELGTIIRGTIPFILLMLLTLLIMYFFPQIATWIPGTMF